MSPARKRRRSRWPRLSPGAATIYGSIALARRHWRPVIWTNSARIMCRVALRECSLSRPRSLIFVVGCRRRALDSSTPPAARPDASRLLSRRVRVSSVLNHRQHGHPPVLLDPVVHSCEVEQVEMSAEPECMHLPLQRAPLTLRARRQQALDPLDRGRPRPRAIPRPHNGRLDDLRRRPRESAPCHNRAPSGPSPGRRGREGGNRRNRGRGCSRWARSGGCAGRRARRWRRGTTRRCVGLVGVRSPGAGQRWGGRSQRRGRRRSVAEGGRLTCRPGCRSASTP